MGATRGEPESRLDDQSGLTLIEIAAAVAVSIIIAATVLVAVTGLVSPAYNTMAVQLLSQTGTAAQGYYASNDRSFVGLTPAVMQSQAAGLTIVTSPAGVNQVGMASIAQAALFGTYDKGINGCLYLAQIYNLAGASTLMGDVTGASGTGDWWSKTPDKPCSLPIENSSLTWSRSPTETNAPASISTSSSSSSSTSSSSSSGSTTSSGSSGSSSPVYGSGILYGMGVNNVGQTGDGNLTNPVRTPAKVVGVNGVGYLSGVSYTAVSGTNGYALVNGNVYAWGDNNDGQLGVGSSSPSYTDTPVEVGTPGAYLSDVISIYASTDWAAALTSSGQIWDWGATPNGTAYTPIQVSMPTGIPPVEAIAIGPQNGLWISGGSVWCWGSDLDGQCGALGQYNPTAYTIYPPQEVPGPGGWGTGHLTGVSSIAEGDDFSTAVVNGHVYEWGDNEYGQLGIDSTEAYTNTPIETTGVGGTGTLGDITAVADGTGHTLALTGSGNVYAWGLDANGQAGPTESHPYIPQQITISGGTSPIAGVNTIAAGGDTSAAAVSGQLYYWGALSGSNSSEAIEMPGWTYIVGLSVGAEQIGVLD